SPDARLCVRGVYPGPHAARLLRDLSDYSAPGGAGDPAKGAGLLHLLAEALQVGGPHLLVLDGLERVQRQAGGYGQIEDPLLKALLLRVAQGLGQTTARVTTPCPRTALTART